MQKDAIKKGVGPNKCTEMGMYRVYVERVSLFLLHAKNDRGIGQGAVEISQVWGKIVENLKCKAREFGVYSVRCRNAFLKCRYLQYVPSSPSSTFGQHHRES